MCGIVACHGPEALDVVLGGLDKLEYRGYDSCGIAAVIDGEIRLAKSVDRIASLAADCEGFRVARAVIGHTRWATHGGVSLENAHPHVDARKSLAIVHNGIIENHSDLRGKASGEPTSETDTESAALLIGDEVRAGGDLAASLASAAGKMVGSFAIVGIVRDSDVMFAMCRSAPLVVATRDGSVVVASDLMAIPAGKWNWFQMQDDDIAVVRRGRVEVVRNRKPVAVTYNSIVNKDKYVSKDGFERFMLKEIYEQPSALRRCWTGLSNKTGEPLPKLGEDALACSRVILVGQGTAYYAAQIGAQIIEDTCRIPAQAEYGSDFRYRDPVLDGAIVVAVSQSGETADTIGAVELARQNGVGVIGVLNAATNSTLARNSDHVVPIHAGAEVGVASTKAFSCQVAALYALALRLAVVQKRIDRGGAIGAFDAVIKASYAVDSLLTKDDDLQGLARKYESYPNFLFLGRGLGHWVAAEGALKLKEISYIHAEGMDAAEMKHGPIALVDENMPVIFLAQRGNRYEKILSNMEEVRSRGGRIIALTERGDERIEGLAEDIIYLPEADEPMSAILAAIPLQLLAYHIAKLKGRNIDKPRNLAKSVTVE